MNNEVVWEREYRSPKLLTLGTEPRKDVVAFLKYLKKQKVDYEGWKALDLGCGAGRNALYLAQRGMEVTGFDLSLTALSIAASRAKEVGLSITYQKQHIGEVYPLSDESCDVVLDIMSSNSLCEAERTVYLEEVSRVLKKGGYFVVRGLAKDGDKHAKELIKKSPGKEYDTYVMPELQLTERVFSEADFRELYGKYFTVVTYERVSHYAQFNGRSYKRQYFIAYLQHA